jgi:ubiquinone/menaquinone biosynthesis C-methylase UbiE
MVDAEQLEALLGFLDLKASDRVVDLGCGIGSQAEHIADRTGAHVLGVDFAEAAIGRAKERTKSRRDRLEFALGDLDDIKLPPRSFNAVVALDSLYFVDDLEKVTADIVNLVAPGGRLAVFYSQIKREDPSEVLEAGGTRFAMALKKLGVAFETRDFTENEFRHWQKELAADAELKPAYEDEGNIDLWASSDEEARQMLDVFKKAEASRYLYMARL